ncbi:MAG TPA: hypothetical protein VIE16_12715, partial [Phenylobacterium sp.]
MPKSAAPSPANDTGASSSTDPEASGAMARWWKVMDFRIGVVPAPVFVAILGVAALYVSLGKAPSDILMNMAVL